MSTILDRIVDSKRQEVERAKSFVPLSGLERQIKVAPPVRDFRAAIQKPAGIQVIAEIKRASPSAGDICADADILAVAKHYEQYGAACISVLTDGPFFRGSLADLTAVREAVSLPVLRKDFVIDPYQVFEARAAGADAVLLIAEILDDPTLTGLLNQIRQLGMEALVEFYEPANLDRVLESGAKLIGVNNRNLHTFEVSLEHTLSLAGTIPVDCCLVSESGIRDRKDVERLEKAGAKAILVGETLMRADDIGGKLRELLGSTESEPPA